jgi:hypothetical protein
VAANNLAATVTTAAATSAVALLRADKDQREGKTGKMRSGTTAIKIVGSRRAVGTPGTAPHTTEGDAPVAEVMDVKCGRVTMLMCRAGVTEDGAPGSEGGVTPSQHSSGASATQLQAGPQGALAGPRRPRGRRRSLYHSRATPPAALAPRRRCGHARS